MFWRLKKNCIRSVSFLALFAGLAPPIIVKPEVTFSHGIVQPDLKFHTNFKLLCSQM